LGGALTLVKRRRGRATRSRTSAPCPPPCLKQSVEHAASTIDEHRNSAVGQHLLRLAAEQFRRQTGAPVGGHGDEIAAACLGGVENALPRLFAFDAYRLARNPFRSRLVAHPREMLLDFFQNE